MYVHLHKRQYTDALCHLIAQIVTLSDTLLQNKE